jgi:hypothetical protein
MGDFDMGRGRETGAWGAWGGHHDQARTDQGYDEPFDRSPVPVPTGWHGGGVKQTGGMVMVRSWHTTERPPDRLRERRREHEYEVGYNARSGGARLTRYRWHPRDGAYVYDETTAEASAPRATDMAQARAAVDLMERHQHLAGGGQR